MYTDISMHFNDDKSGSIHPVLQYLFIHMSTQREEHYFTTPVVTFSERGFKK